MTRHPRLIIALASSAALLALAAPAASPVSAEGAAAAAEGSWTGGAEEGYAPDLPGHGTEAGPVATASSPIGAGALRRGLRRALKDAGGRSVAWFADLSADDVLFKRGARTRLQIASNMKLFTTSTALTRLGPAETAETELWAVGKIEQNELNGYLVLRGGGDPSLTAPDLRELAAELRGAGIRSVTGKLAFDESVFDTIRSIPEHGIDPEYPGTLSGLTFERGASANPGEAAALTLIAMLRKKNVQLPRTTRARLLDTGDPSAFVVGSHSSAPLADLVAQTNKTSDNFFAEMLLKLTGARVRGTGSTNAGLKVVKKFAAGVGSAVRAENGSGLSRRVQASPLAIGRLLEGVIEADPVTADAFVDSLAVPGGFGTLSDRMTGTAAARRCHAKTGTLSGVSVLSGYCFVGGKTLAFSILCNRVDVDRARRAQDRMVTLLARYSG